MRSAAARSVVFMRRFTWTPRRVGAFPMKRNEYLVVFDYGMGGIWGWVTASSLDEIAAKAPKLTVLQRRPDWMSDEQLNKIREDSSFDIDSISASWNALLEG